MLAKLNASVPALATGTIEYNPEAAMRRRSRISYIALGALTAGFIGSATLVPIGSAVVGSGKVGVESRIKRVAHPTGGVIAEIGVHNGDHVQKGQPLIRFDDAVDSTDADLSTLSTQQLLARRARLEAERIGAAQISFPVELTQSSDQRAKNAMKDERELFRLRNGDSSGIAAQLQSQLSGYQEQISGYRRQIEALARQQDLLAPEREGIDKLYKKGLVTISRRNELERSAAEIDRTIAGLRSEIAQAQTQIGKTREQMVQIGNTRRSDAATQLADVNDTLNRQQIHEAQANDLQKRNVLRAAYSGVVDKLAFAAVGDVVKPAETVMEIVPDSDRMVVECAIRPGDIDQVHVGQAARVRFSGFNSATTPVAKAHVLNVAADRTTAPQTGQSYYQVRVRLDNSNFSREQGITLISGMPAEVFISTGNRSMISYLTKPLRDQFARAFRDG